MFGDILITVLNIFIGAPDAFIALATKMVSYILEHKLYVYVFVIMLSVIAIRFFIEKDSFAFFASIMQLVTISIIAFILLVNWTKFIPSTGLSISNELISVVMPPDPDSDADTQECMKSISIPTNADGKAQSEISASAKGACYLGRKIEKAIDQLTMPITTSADIPESNVVPNPKGNP